MFEILLGMVSLYAKLCLKESPDKHTESIGAFFLWEGGEKHRTSVFGRIEAILGMVGRDLFGTVLDPDFQIFVIIIPWRSKPVGHGS